MPWTFKEMLQNCPLKPGDTRVILIRHGQSTANAAGQYQGSSDESVLTTAGRAAALQTGEFLSGVAVDALYTSSLQRAQATASEIATSLTPALDLQAIYVVPQLREIDLPGWQGLPHRQVQEQFSEAYRCWRQHPHKFQLQTPEGSCFPVLDLYKRAQQFWQDVLPRHQGQTLVVVSHAGTNRALISTALGISPAYYQTIQQSNCGISVLRFGEGQLANAQLETLNCIGHLGKPLSTNLPQLKAGTQGLRILLLPTPANSEQVQRVKHLLQSVDIQLSLSGHSESAALAAQILEHHNQAIHLLVQREDFLEHWQQEILACSRSQTKVNKAESTLLTALVIDKASSLHRLAHDVLGLPVQSQQLQLHPGTLSVLHYPGAEHLPMLQALNLGIGQVSDSATVLNTALVV
jgi:phosphoserine phosphatase